MEFKHLLIKYINHIKDCEGDDFIGELNHYMSEEKFTGEEVEFLEAISEGRYKKIEKKDFEYPEYIIKNTVKD